MRLTINVGDAVTEEHRAMLKRAVALGFTDPRLTERHVQTLIKYGPKSPLLQDYHGIFLSVPASLFEVAQEYLIEMSCEVHHHMALDWMDGEAEALERDRKDAEYEANMEQAYEGQQHGMWLHDKDE